MDADASLFDASVRLDLAAAARAEAVGALGARVDPHAVNAFAAALEAAARDAYITGRVNGLCHEGALELFRDALREAGRRAARDAGGTPVA